MLPMFHLFTVHVLLALMIAVGVPATEVFDHSFTIHRNFSDTFVFGELTARLEACASPRQFSSLGNSLKQDCLHTLVSRSFNCFPVGDDLICVLNGVYVNASEISFECNDVLGCVDTSALVAAEPPSGCGTITMTGFIGDCYPSAYCQLLGESGLPVSFGDFCPSPSGDFCCGNNVSEASVLFQGAFLASPTSMDFLRDVSHVTDLNVTVHYEIEAPSLIKIVVEVPYATSDKLCPSTYMIDFGDPVEPFPRKEDGYYRRTDNEELWEPLHYLPVSDLLGRPRSACGNFDFKYTSEADFRSKFTFPDLQNSTDRFTYGAVPNVDSGVWDSSLSTYGIPSGADTFWKIGVPNNGRVNYTSTSEISGSGFDLIKTFYQCKDYVTSERLVKRNIESDYTYLNGVPYPVETYEWNLHICQVGFFGENCDDIAQAQMYAKTCAKIPSSFSIAPQQVSHVATQNTSSLGSKTFLQSVNSLASNCTFGHERIAIAFSFIVFANEYALFEDKVHDILSPTGIFDAEQVDISFHNATYISTVTQLLESGPTKEGVFKLRPTTIAYSTASVLSQKLVVVTKCYNTGYDAIKRERTNPAVFAEAVEDGDGRVMFDLELVLKKHTSSFDIRNTLSIRVLSTRETFVLQTTVSLLQGEATATHKLYGSYEMAQADVSASLSNALPEGQLTMRGGDQICSKHQLVGYEGHSTILNPNAVAACMLSVSGQNTKDGDGVLLAGREVLYQTPSMHEPASYVFGCINDWLDLSQASLSPQGVYSISTVQRSVNNHESAFWFVTKGKLSEIPLPGTTESLADRFGTGLFYYNATSGAHQVSKSNQMQVDSITAQLSLSGKLRAGCVENNGNLKAACNLVCFDLVNGLLTPTGVDEERMVLVHHMSVATVATEEQSGSAHRFGTATQKRRSLLEAPVGEGGYSHSKVKHLRVKPSERHHIATEVGSGVGISENNSLGAEVFYTVLALTLVTAAIGALCFCNSRRRRPKNAFTYSLIK